MSMCQANIMSCVRINFAQFDLDIRYFCSIWSQFF